MLIRFFSVLAGGHQMVEIKEYMEILCSQTDTLKGKTPVKYAEQNVKYWLFEKRLVLHLMELYRKIFYTVSGNLKFFS